MSVLRGVSNRLGTITTVNDATLIGITTLPFTGVGVALGSDSVTMGDGRSVSNPTGTIVAVDSGVAGNVTGTVKYAYTESPLYGETLISPITTITVTNKKVTLTIPGIRRGMISRKIYRTVAGGSTFKLLYTPDGGHGIQQSTFTDDILDANLGVDAPTSNTSKFFTAWINPSVKFLASNPDIVGSAAADFTAMTTTGDGSTGYSMDQYGSIVARTFSSTGFSFLSFGINTGYHYLAKAVTDNIGDSSDVTVFSVGGLGHTTIVPSAALSDPTLGNGKANAFSVTSTFGSSNTASATAVALTATGAGSAAFNQAAFVSNLGAGYTGSSQTYAARGINTTAGSGFVYGTTGLANGAGTGTNVGVSGVASTATKNIGVYGSADGTFAHTSALTWGSGVNAAGGWFTNGSSSNDIIVGADGVTPVFRITNDGDMTLKNIGGTTTLTVLTTTGGASGFVKANGGTSWDLGSSNNVPVRMYSNNALTWTFDTSKSLVPGASLSTSMTGGFINIPGAAGAPSGTPTNTTGFPMYWDSTNLKIYVYSGGAWKATAALS